MYKILILITAAFVSSSAVADQNSTAEAELRETVIAFNKAYADNDVALYFSYFAEDADMYWYGARQTTAGCRDDWIVMVKAGGAVEKKWRIRPRNQDVAWQQSRHRLVLHRLPVPRSGR